MSRAQCCLGLAKGALLLLWQRLQTAAGRNGVQEATIEVTREGQRPSTYPRPMHRDLATMEAELAPGRAPAVGRTAGAAGFLTFTQQSARPDR